MSIEPKQVFSSPDAAPVVLYVKRDANSDDSYPIVGGTDGTLPISGTTEITNDSIEQATVKSANLTKYDAGGTGDNIIEDGFIKSVEKVWVDTYTFSSANTIGVGLILEIASVPPNKKILGVEVYGLSTIAATTSTVAIGLKRADGTTNSTLFMAACTFGTVASNLIQANAGIGTVITGGTNRIILTFGGASLTVTGGTITTIVKYT